MTDVFVQISFHFFVDFHIVTPFNENFSQAVKNN